MTSLGDSIVNPRCDDCGRSMSTPRPHQIGFPRQCGFCAEINAARIQAAVEDCQSQERPRNRSFHVVKLPPGMMKG